MQFMGHGLKLKESSTTNDPLMSLRARIMTQVEQVALDQKQNLARLSDDLKPFDLLHHRLRTAAGKDVIGIVDDVNAARISQSPDRRSRFQLQESVTEVLQGKRFARYTLWACKRVRVPVICKVRGAKVHVAVEIRRYFC
jgi:hypothetical protein